jgi:hypothetical protein
MATMIPSRIDSSAPSSERFVFDLFREDPDTVGWTVLHSVGLASRGVKPYGEIDFVVLVPGGGIVCLEVKGGRVRCENGIWHTRNREGVESQLGKSPIMQVRAGMFALRRAIQTHFGDASEEGKTLIASAVVLPDVPAPPLGVEAAPWEFIDSDGLSARPIGRTIQTILRRESERLGRPQLRGANSGVLKTIRAFLRPDFDLVVSRRTTIARAEEQLVRLTEGQFDVLDSLALNDRCIVDGAAGTGKTLVALEIARRAKSAGARPFVLCDNRLLGRWIESELAGSGCVGGSYHRTLRQLITTSGVREAFLADTRASGQAPDFGEWPTYALEALGERGTLTDLLVVDEAQDLATDADPCVLDAMIEGGLAGGRWVLLGDFTRQAIFGGASATLGFAGFEQVLRNRAPHLAVLRLTRNCRNTRQIAEETAMLSGFEHLPYRLNEAEGPAVDYRFWNTSDEQLDRLGEAISALVSDGLRPEHITILSPLRLENSIASRIRERGFQVADVGSGDAVRAGALCFATMQSFKGMETSAAILTDLRGMEDVARHALLYVGMSRARTVLVMLVHTSFRPYVQAAVRRRLQEQS